MSSERWRRIEAIYHAALSRPFRERSAYLGAACAGDGDLRREVESLLAQTGALSEHFDGAPLSAIPNGVVTTTPNPTSLIGERLGHFRIIDRLGVGGMGEVYRARDTKLGREVAIKILPQAFTSDPARLARFEREARVLASLNHPHIGGIYGVEDTGGVRALVLELIDGQTLADRIRHGPLPLTQALSIAGQLATALDAAHERGIVHRDLKPANIKITAEGVVKVLDFGIAKASSEMASGEASRAPTVTLDRTHEGLIVGTAAYMSPEQARGQTVDKQADIWAFGCVVYEMLTGRSAFARVTILAGLPSHGTP
jgi:serine/threonine protein kinase